MLARFRPDPYVLALIGAVIVAAILPCRGEFARVLGIVAEAGIALVFFLHGGRLPRDVIVRGLTRWQLQLVVVLATFALFPLLGLALRLVLAPGPIATGLLFLTILPSTVQSSIAFTSIARGNVPAAICAAAVSNALGVFLTPLLAALLLGGAEGASPSLDAVRNIVLFLLVPFAAGHLLRPWIAGFLERRRAWLGWVDRGSILFVVYIAFSEGVVAGIWHQLPVRAVVLIFVASAVLLAVVLGALTWLSRRLGFTTEDEIAIVFCGSKKSLASGLPMAKLLFAGPTVGLVVLPLMLFHQLQLMVCAAVAQRYARRSADPQS